jgi:hypothetical protein
MRLTEGLASTTAQALPIFALAASLEILTIHRSYGAEIRLMQAFVRGHTASWAPRLAVVIASARWIVVLVYFALILYDIRAEFLCLRVLGGDQGLGHYGNDIQNAVLFSFTAVVLIPRYPGDPTNSVDTLHQAGHYVRPELSQISAHRDGHGCGRGREEVIG